MTHTHSIPEVVSERLAKLLIEPVKFFRSRRAGTLAADEENDPDREELPAEDLPLPDEGEIFPNRRPPQEEEYLPDEQERITEDPKEIPDPYFPEKTEGLPPIKEDEFPQTDPV